MGDVVRKESPGGHCWRLVIFAVGGWDLRPKDGQGIGVALVQLGCQDTLKRSWMRFAVAVDAKNMHAAEAIGGHAGHQGHGRPADLMVSDGDCSSSTHIPGRLGH